MIVHPGKREKVDFFFSFRSPYSYLAAPRACRLEENFHIKVEFRGVLPMVQRGHKVSRAKALYLVRDAAREARRLGMPFGRIFDPVGTATKRCLAIAEWAKDHSDGLHWDFILRTSRAIWAEGVNTAEDKQLARLCESVGLSWSECRSAIDDPAYAERVDDNRERLAAAGHWGVPTFVYKDQVFWGQDRIDFLELALGEAGLSTAHRISG